jgi:hypothetical protein
LINLGFTTEERLAAMLIIPSSWGSQRAVTYKPSPVTFNVGDFVYLRVTPLKGMQRFHVKGKLAPRYTGPFKILDRKGAMS